LSLTRASLLFLSLSLSLSSEAILEDPAFFSRPVIPMEPHILPPPVPQAASSEAADSGAIFSGASAEEVGVAVDPRLLVDDRLRGHWYGAPTQIQLAMEYLALCRQYPPRKTSTMRGHLMKFLYR
jgi:hypothetical protein